MPGWPLSKIETCVVAIFALALGVAVWLLSGSPTKSPPIFFNRFVFRGEVLSPADLRYSLPPWQYAYSPGLPKNSVRSDEALLYQPVMLSHWKRLKHGDFPERDPSLLSGDVAFFQGLFTGLTVYPLSLVYYLASPLKADGLFAIVRLWLAGLFMYAYCRKLQLHPIAAAGAAFAYMLNGHFIVWLTSPIPTVALWLPLVLLFVERLLEHPDARSLGLMAAALAPMANFSGASQERGWDDCLKIFPSAARDCKARVNRRAVAPTRPPAQLASILPTK